MAIRAAGRAIRPSPTRQAERRQAHYWRVATYDRFNGSNWDQTDRVGVRVEPGDEILGATPREGVEFATRDPIDVEFTAIQPSGDSVLSPGHRRRSPTGPST
jgi:hypothetical protein